MEPDAGAESEGVSQTVGGDRPALCEIRQDRAALVDPGQSLHYIGVENLLDWRGRALRRVEVRRLEHHADDDAIGLRRRRRQGGKKQDSEDDNRAAREWPEHRVQFGM